MDSIADTLDVGKVLGSRGFVSPSAAIPLIVGILIYILYVSHRSPLQQPKLIAPKKQATQTDLPPIPYIRSVPDSLPFIGNILPLGGRTHRNDSTIYTSWSRTLRTDLFQLRLGNQRTLVASSFSTIKDLWIGHSNDLIDRPFQHGFADKLQLDILGAAMTEEIRRCRKAAMRALGKPSWTGYYPLLEPSSVDLVGNAYKKGEMGESLWRFIRI